MAAVSLRTERVDQGVPVLGDIGSAIRFRLVDVVGFAMTRC